jgi:hypothetical protein
MKKLLTAAATVGMVCLSSMAYAVDVTVDGEINIRSRSFSELDLNKNDGSNDAHQTFTQERVLLEVNAKASDNLKGKVAIWNDFDTWGRFESPQGNQTTAAEDSPLLSSPTPTNSGFLSIREAWIDFTLPGLPVGVKAGHQLLQLSQGWFFRSNYMGSDAWVVYMPSGNNMFALSDVKAFEGSPAQAHDDIDFYTALGNFKLGGDMTVGFDVTRLDDRSGMLIRKYVSLLTGISAPLTAGGMSLVNVGLNVTGTAGTIKLKGELDVQDGKWEGAASGGTEDLKFNGNQVVVQGSLPADPVTINMTLARGSGDKVSSATDTGSKYEGMVDFQDIAQHYTLLYEYKVVTAAGFRNTGFANTTAISAGAMVNLSKSVVVGGDVWYFMATEKANINPATGGYGTGDLSRNAGTEVDLKAHWQLYDNLSWNWTLGYFKPGSVYRQADGSGTDAATGIQGYLVFKF